MNELINLFIYLFIYSLIKSLINLSIHSIIENKTRKASEGFDIILVWLIISIWLPSWPRHWHAVLLHTTWLFPPITLHDTRYLRQGGYVFAFVFLFVCQQENWKVVEEFWWFFWMGGMCVL